MSDPYLGEILLFAGNFAPVGWAFCNGASIPASQNVPLYQLIENTYGGVPFQSFLLPNLQRRVPIHAGQGANSPTNYELGSFGGSEQITLSAQQMPTHTHAPTGAANGTSPQSGPGGNVWANDPTGQASIYYTMPTPPPTPPPTISPMLPSTITPTGSSLAHENRQPSLALNFCICISGTYPIQPTNPI